MSIAIVKINNRKLAIVKKLVNALNGKIRVLTNVEEAEKQIMLKLIEESDISEIVSEAEAKNYFKKYGIEIERLFFQRTFLKNNIKLFTGYRIITVTSKYTASCNLPACRQIGILYLLFKGKILFLIFMLIKKVLSRLSS